MRACCVCADELDTDDMHTYHAEGCPLRESLEAADYESCYEQHGCGEDVHAECCPTCTGQAF